MKQILSLRLALVFLASLLFTSTAFAQTTHRKLDGFCELGNRTVTIFGGTSTTKVQQSMPSCTVTVFNAGTAVLATICSDNIGPTCTSKPNPFTADTSGYWAFFAASAQYDVQFTGGTSPNIFPSPFVRSSLTIPSPFTGASAVTNPSGVSTDNAIARFDGATGLVIQNSTVILGDTGNITGLGTLNTHTIPGGTDTFTLNSASQTLTNKLFVSPSNVLGGVGVAIGGDATGDTWFRNAGGIFTRLPIGSSGQVLSVSGGLPIWASSVLPPFTDTTSIVQGSADATKQIRFEVDGLTTATVRTLTPPDANIIIAGANFLNAWADGVKQTFNPDGTNAGINVGQHTTDPSSPVNGDCYYNSIANEFRCRINSTWIALSGGGGGGGTPGGITGNIQWNSAGTFAGLAGSVVTSVAEVSLTTSGRTSPTNAGFAVASGADTAMAADTENVFGRFAGSTRGFTQGAGAFTSQREWIITAPTYTFTAADSINIAATLAITGGPVAGTNATITNQLALWVQKNPIQLGTGSSDAGSIRLMNSVNVNALTLSSGTTTSQYTLTFPPAPPAANECLRMTSAGLVQTTGADCGTGGGGTTINPTDTVVPYRSNATTFLDSSWSVALGVNGLAATSTVPARTTGTTHYLRILTPADITMTADTPSVGIQFGGNTSAGTVIRQFNSGAGAFTNQRETIFVAPTYAFTAADSISFAATVYADPPIAGTNATIGQSYAVWSGGDLRVDGRALINHAGVSPNGQLHVVSSAASVTVLFGQGDTAQTAQLLLLRRGSTPTFAVLGRGQVDMDPAAFTSGVPQPSISLITPAHTGIDNTEAPEIFWDFGATVNFLGGGAAITNQRVIRLGAGTYSAAAAQTITTAALLSLSGPPVAGTNVTFTNPALSLFVESGPIQLGRSSTATGSIRFAVSGDADVTTLQAGDLPVSSIVYKWPADDPAATQVLTVTSFAGGVAVLEWAAGGGGGGCTPGGVQGDYQINNGAGGCAAGVITQGTNGRVIASPTAAGSGVNPYLRIVAPADTAQTLDTEFPGIFLGGSSSGATVIRQGADGTTYALQREIIAPAPTYAFVGATTVTDTVTLEAGAPIQGTNATLTRRAHYGWNGADGTAIALHGRNVDLGSNLVISTHDSGGQVRLELFRDRLRFFEGEGQVANTFSGGAISIGTGNVTQRVMVDSAGLVGINKASAIGAQLHVVSGATTRIGALFESAANSTVELINTLLIADDTSTVAAHTINNCRSNGVAATGFGCSETFNLESSTTNDQAATRVSSYWNDAVHATRQAAWGVATNNINTATLVDRITAFGDATFATLAIGNGIFNAAPLSIGRLTTTNATGTNIAAGILNLTAGTSTGTGAPGQITISFTTQSVTAGTAQNTVDGGNYRIAPTMFTTTSTATVANTVTETTVIGTILAGDSVIGSGVMNPGRSVTVTFSGHVAATASPTLTIRFKLGATTIATKTFLTFAPSGTSQIDCTFTLTGRTFSATGTVFSQGVCRVVGDNLTEIIGGGVNTATTTIDWTVDQTVGVTAQWSAAAAGNTISITNMIARWDN